MSSSYEQIISFIIILLIKDFKLYKNEKNNNDYFSIMHIYVIVISKSIKYIFYFYNHLRL